MTTNTAFANDPWLAAGIRALYADDRSRFEALTAPWPIGVRQLAIGLAWGDEPVIAGGNG
jgi:hypothetical protein